jgi:dTMP kinase
LDGAGTTTQLERLGRALRERGLTVTLTREPSDGPVGTLIRQALTKRLRMRDGAPLSPETLALLFAADRVDHVGSEIAPALERGEWVLSDRYLLSSLAYQSPAVPMKWVETVNAFAPPPDLTLFVDVRPATAAKRRAHRGGAGELFEDEVTQRRVLRQYRQALRLRMKRERISIVRGEGSPEEVTRLAWSQIERVFGSP